MYRTSPEAVTSFASDLQDQASKLGEETSELVDSNGLKGLLVASLGVEPGDLHVKRAVIFSTGFVKKLGLLAERTVKYLEQTADSSAAVARDTIETDLTVAESLRRTTAAPPHNSQSPLSFEPRTRAT